MLYPRVEVFAGDADRERVGYAVVELNVSSLIGCVAIIISLLSRPFSFDQLEYILLMRLAIDLKVYLVRRCVVLHVPTIAYPPISGILRHSEIRKTHASQIVLIREHRSQEIRQLLRSSLSIISPHLRLSEKRHELVDRE